MGLDRLSDGEQEVVGECLRAAAFGPFFVDERADAPFWEIHSLFGPTHEELATVVRPWPEVDEADASVRLAIDNSMNNLLGYPHGREDVRPEYISVSEAEVDRIYRLWRGRGVA